MPSSKKTGTKKAKTKKAETKKKASDAALDKATVTKAETFLIDRALAKSLSEQEIRSVLQAEGFAKPVIEHIVSRSVLVMKKYTAIIPSIRVKGK